MTHSQQCLQTRDAGEAFCLLARTQPLCHELGEDWECVGVEELEESSEGGRITILNHDDLGHGFLHADGQLLLKDLGSCAEHRRVRLDRISLHHELDIAAGAFLP